MEVPDRGKSPSKSSTRFGTSEEQLREGQLNLERTLRALDQRGEKGLQAELDRIYPPTGRQELESATLSGPGVIPLHVTRVKTPRPASLNPLNKSK